MNENMKQIRSNSSGNLKTNIMFRNNKKCDSQCGKKAQLPKKNTISLKHLNTINC